MLLNHERIWIAGAQGQVGSAFAQLLDTVELEVLLTDKSDVDVTNMDEVRKYAEMNRPDVIINCTGIGGIEYCQQHSDLAYKVNAIGARNLSVAARSVHGKMVQLSTDDIFDGKAAESYNEFSIPTPVSIYGKSKLAGEEFVKTIAPRYLIIRSSWVYGKGENFVTWLLQEAKKSKEIFVAEDLVRLPDQRQRAGEGDLPSFNGRRLRIISCSLPGSMQPQGICRKNPCSCRRIQQNRASVRRQEGRRRTSCLCGFRQSDAAPGRNGTSEKLGRSAE